MIYITCHEREKKEKKSNNHQQQSDHNKLLHVTLNGRVHNDTSRKTMEGYLRPRDGITRAT